MEKLNKFFAGVKAKVAAGTALVVASGAASAEPSGPDWSQLTDAIAFDGIAPVVLGAGAALLALLVIIKGVRIVMGMVGGGR